MSAALPPKAAFEQSPKQSRGLWSSERASKQSLEELSAADVAGRTSPSSSTTGTAPSSKAERQGWEDEGVTEAEIRQHKSHQDAWVVVDGIVYDITQFLETHPGGSQVIVELLQSKDIGKVMRGEEPRASHSHSQYAFRMLQQFRIGRVRGSSNTGEKSQLPNSSASEETRYTIDLKKPLVFQVGKLGAHYYEWVHTPILEKEPPRFFESDLVEYFTKTVWWAIPALWGPLVIFTAMAALSQGLWLSTLPVGMATGACIWTFIEYLLHRFVFHMKTSGYWSITAHYFLHGFHHKHPMDSTRLVFPPAMTGLVIVVIWYLTEPLCYLVGRPMKVSMVSGGLLMYIVYDLTHYFLHFGKSFNHMTHMLKEYHLNHHFKDYTNAYGVTMPFWDMVFDTFPQRGYKRYHTIKTGK